MLEFGTFVGPFTLLGAEVGPLARGAPGIVTLVLELDFSGALVTLDTDCELQAANKKIVTMLKVPIQILYKNDFFIIIISKCDYPVYAVVHPFIHPVTIL